MGKSRVRVMGDSLTDAEPAEYFVEQIVAASLTGDLLKRVRRLLQIREWELLG